MRVESMEIKQTRITIEAVKLLSASHCEMQRGKYVMNFVM